MFLKIIHIKILKKDKYETIIKSGFQHVKHGCLSNNREELIWYMTGITDGWIKM